MMPRPKDPTDDSHFGYWPGSATGEVAWLRKRLAEAEAEISRLLQEQGRIQRGQVRHG